MADYRPDAEFVVRLRQLIGDTPVQVVADRVGLHRNYVRDLLEGRAANPTYNMLKKLCSLKPWATVSWLAEGHDEDEDDITTIAALHGWSARIERQRERYVERILAQQVARATRPAEALSPEAERLTEEALRDTQRREAQASRGTRPPAHAETPAAALPRRPRS